MTKESFNEHKRTLRKISHPLRRLSFVAASVWVSFALLLGCGAETPAPPSEATETSAGVANAPEGTEAPPPPSGVPIFELDPSWPAPLSDSQARWPDLSRNAWSIAIDSRDHVWVLQSPTPEQLAREAAGAIVVPRVFEFDPTGTYLNGWGGPRTSYTWMENPDPGTPYPAGTPAEHGMWVDSENNVWVTGNGHVALKFSAHGELLLQIGQVGQTGGSNDQALLGNSCELTVDPAHREVYIADGYLNRRVVVFDSRTGDYKRHWGAYGNTPVDFELDENGLYTDDSQRHRPGGPPQPQFLAVHCVRVAHDGLVYVCDRQRNRVQVFQRDGAFVTEFDVAPDTPAELGFPSGVGATNFGSASTIGFSKDPTQHFIYVGDNMNAKIWIYRRPDLELIGSIDTDPLANHYLAVDSHGHLYNSGLQKFVLTGFTDTP